MRARFLLSAILPVALFLCSFQISSAQIPEFVFKLLTPSQAEFSKGPDIFETITEFVDRFIYGTCTPSDEPKHCDIDGAVNENGTYRINWICLGYPDGCSIRKDGQPFLSVNGAGFLDDLPITSGTRSTLEIISSDNSCRDEWPLIPPATTPPPVVPACPVSASQTVTSIHTKFQDNEIISGFEPYFRFIANSNGTVNVSLSASRFIGGPAVSGYRRQLAQSRYRYNHQLLRDTGPVLCGFGYRHHDY